MKKIFLSAILAGAVIAFGGTVFLSVENTVVGSIFFTIGLFVVCTRGLHLFTGKVCYVFDNDAAYAKTLPVIWLGNLVGTALIALAEKCTRLVSLSARAQGICELKLSAMMLLIGGLYLIFRKVISWQIPVAYIGTVAVLTFLFPQGNDAMSWMLYNVLGGGLFLGAFFMATDYVTSPVTKKGQLIFGIGCGLITVFIRYFGSYPEGVCYSILVMNCCTWIIDKYTKPTRFGVDKKAAKEAAKK